MNVGFIGFGEVASILATGLLKEGANVYTCLNGRSLKTKQRTKNIRINLCHDNQSLMELSDIILSTVTPSQAIPVALNVSKMEGIFVDLNNISPETVKNVLSNIKNGKIVDASIMGSILKEGIGVKIIASGPNATEFAVLNKYGMNIEVIGSQIGQASAIKMLRSAYTKGVSALLLESTYVAYRLGVDDQVLSYISDTECPEFIESSVSRMISSAFHAQRKYEEMCEVKNVIALETDPVVTKATMLFFEKLSQNLPELEKRPKDLQEIFQIINNFQK